MAVDWGDTAAEHVEEHEEPVTSPAPDIQVSRGEHEGWGHEAEATAEVAGVKCVAVYSYTVLNFRQKGNQRN